MGHLSKATPFSKPTISSSSKSDPEEDDPEEVERPLRGGHNINSRLLGDLRRHAKPSLLSSQPLLLAFPLWSPWSGSMAPPTRYTTISTTFSKLMWAWFKSEQRQVVFSSLFHLHVPTPPCERAELLHSKPETSGAQCQTNTLCTHTQRLRI